MLLRRKLKSATLITTTLITTIGSMFSGSTLAGATMPFGNLNKGALNDSDLAFVGANVMNPSKGTTIADATILVSQGNIVRIQPDTQNIPANYAVVDVQDKWVLPGLIDGHIHLAQSGSAFTRPDTINATKIMPYEKDQQWLLENTEDILEDYLKHGITTVYDLGGPSEYLSHYQKVASSSIAPDIYAAGTLLSPMAIPQLSLNGNTFTQVTNAEEALAMVRKQLALNTNMIKIVWSQETGLSTEQLYDLFRPAILLAHKNNRVVAVHVEDLANAKMAIKAGGNILVHGVMNDHVDDEFIALMRKHSVTYMPTLSAYSHYFELFKNELAFTAFEKAHGHEEIIGSFDQLMENVANTDQMFQIFLKYVPLVDAKESELAKLTAREQHIVKQLQAAFSTNIETIQKSNLAKMIAAGVNVAFGTDAGNPGTLHAASIMGELDEWKKAGAKNIDILKAMTFGNAVALQLQNYIGTLAADMHANFVVLDEDPTQRLSALASPYMTVKRGGIVKQNTDNKGTE